MSVAWVGAGIAAVSAVSQNSAAKKAAKSQQQGADAAIASQEYMFDETNRLNEPFRETGLAANNKLAQLLGLSTVDSPDQAYDLQTFVDFNNGLNPGNPNNQADAQAKYDRYTQGIYGSDAETAARYGFAAPTTQPQSSGFGSLLRNYGQSDAENDYIYQTQKQFGLDEGAKGLSRAFAANGSMLSGAAAKALTRFGNDYAGTKLNESYNRFENNKTGTYNKLAGMSGAGQQATNQITAAGQNMANNNSATQIGLGNARGASAIAQGNALSNGLSTAYNGYQQNQLMNSFNQPKQQAYYGSGGMGGFGDSYSTSYGE